MQPTTLRAVATLCLVASPLFAQIHGTDSQVTRVDRFWSTIFQTLPQMAVPPSPLGDLGLPLLFGGGGGGGGPTACNPIEVRTNKNVYRPQEDVIFTVTGVPGTTAVILVDTDPGPVNIPFLGLVHVGLSPNLGQIGPFTLPASGVYQFPCHIPCPGVPSLTIYTQAVSADIPTMTLCLGSFPSITIEDPLAICRATACVGATEIKSNFNGTLIPANSTVWFNSVVSVDGLGASGGSFGFRNGKIKMTINNAAVEVPVPDSLVIFSTSATTATTSFDSGLNTWTTTVPASYSGNVFLGGVGLPAGSAGLPAGINPVTWSGEFVADVAGLSWKWKWGAAVYATFSTDYNALGVKPVDDNKLSAYQNSDHAGTPENYKTNVKGGARGGGGSNFTGSYSATGSAKCAGDR